MPLQGVPLQGAVLFQHALQGSMLLQAAVPLQGGDVPL